MQFGLKTTQRTDRRRRGSVSPRAQVGLRSRGKNEHMELSDDFSALEEAEMAEEERAELMESGDNVPPA